MGLTDTQAKARAFIEAYDRRHGTAPTVDEVREHMGLASKSGAHRIVSELVQRGHIRRIPNRTRALEIVHERPPLAQFSTEALIAELNRRGIEA